MNTQEIALRYSKALFSLAVDEHEKKLYLSAMEEMTLLLKDYPVIKTFFDTPHISQNKKIWALEKCLEFSSNSTVKFFKYLLYKRRFNLLPDICSNCQKMMAEASGILNGRLITPLPVDPHTKKNLITKLENIFGKELTLNEEIDPQLLGGGIVIIGNQLIDFSIQNKLMKLKDDLLAKNI